MTKPLNFPCPHVRDKARAICGRITIELTSDRLPDPIEPGTFHVCARCLHKAVTLSHQLIHGKVPKSLLVEEYDRGYQCGLAEREDQRVPLHPDDVWQMKLAAAERDRDAILKRYKELEVLFDAITGAK